MTGSPLTTPLLTPRVLVVDGDLDNRELHRESLTLAGWHVIEACDGREALVLALKSTPWVIVTELRLQLIDGISLCEILRRDRATARVPILVVTSETRIAELARATRAGADAVLTKPSAPEMVVAELRRLVERSPRFYPPPPLPSPAGRRTVLVKAHRRITTTTPPDPPADLNCPICGRRLRYEQTYIGGVSSRHAERWDYFSCLTCGQFQYRYRTRKLRRL